MNRLSLTFLFLVLWLFCLYIFLPVFLLYRDPPARSDAVMLMIGHDMNRPVAGAEALTKKGYASLLLIPARNKILKYDPVRCLFQNTGYSIAAESLRCLVRRLKDGFPCCPENTDVEFRIGLALMQKLDIYSAIVVSSPYHMRRIRMIVLHDARNAGRRFLFVPADGKQGFDPLWIFDTGQVKWVFTEYAKILWFSAYSRFIPDDVLSKEKTQNPGSVTVQ